METIPNYLMEESPAYKLMDHGKRSLSNAELLSMLIPNNILSAKETANKMFENCDLITISRLSVHELTRYEGIGVSTARLIVAAFELGRRREATQSKIIKKISCSNDAFIQMKFLQESLYEEFWTIFLNRGNKILKKEKISEGGLIGTVADPKKIFKIALETYAASIILCHNHPSGNIKPSESDIRLTQKLKKAGSFLDLPVIDHIIIGGTEGYFSFADENLL